MGLMIQRNVNGHGTKQFVEILIKGNNVKSDLCSGPIIAFLLEDFLIQWVPWQDLINQVKGILRFSIIKL